MKRAERAEENFKKGLNCAQSVVLAFSDLTGMSREDLLRISAPFGGGIGRMREVCGTVSGMMMITGLVFYNAKSPTTKEKSELYAREQELASRFRKMNGSIICRELLSGVTSDSSPRAEERTEEYYKKRPCSQLCADAAMILEEYLKEQGILDAEGEGVQ